MINPQMILRISPMPRVLDTTAEDVKANLRHITKVLNLTSLSFKSAIAEFLWVAKNLSDCYKRHKVLGFKGNCQNEMQIIKCAEAHKLYYIPVTSQLILLPSY